MRLRRLSLAVALLALATLAVPGRAAADPDDGNRAWSVRPATEGKPDRRTHYTLQGAPGTTVEDQVLVTNASTVAAPFTIYATDAFNTDTGAFDLLAAAKKPVDIGAWVSFPTPTVTIAAGASVAVPFKIAIPANATPGDHAGGVLVSLATGTDVKLDTRVAVRLYLRIAGLLRPVLAAKYLQAAYSGVGNPFGSGSVALTYTVVNSGNIRLQSHAKVVVRSAIFGNTLSSKTLADLPELLPRQQVTYHAELSGVFPAGPLNVSVELQPFNDPAQPVGQAVPAASGTTTIWAWPWLLLVFGLAFAVGSFFLVRHLVLRRKRARAANDAAELARRREARKAAKKGALVP